MQDGKMAEPQSSQPGDRGFVLLLVLALTAVIAVSAIALLQIGRRDRLSIRAELSSAQTDFALDAALNRASQALANPEDEMRNQLLAGVTPATWTFVDTEISIEVVAESGKIDVNTSDAELRQAGLRLADRLGIRVENK